MSHAEASLLMSGHAPAPVHHPLSTTLERPRPQWVPSELGGAPPCAQTDHERAAPPEGDLLPFGLGQLAEVGWHCRQGRFSLRPKGPSVLALPLKKLFDQSFGRLEALVLHST